MLKKIHDNLFMKVDEEVKREIDLKSLNIVWHTCLVVFFFEAMALLIYLTTRKTFDEASWLSIKSVSFCLGSCLFGIICSGIMRKKDDLNHHVASLFNGVFYLLLSFWGVDVALRNYRNNEQILTFFAVQLMMVCFVLLHPIIGALFVSIIYICMYAAMYGIDGAAGINSFNYVLLFLISLTGMTVRYYSENLASMKSVELSRSNDKLFYTNRHDGLTGLRNRKALHEDVEKIIKSHVDAYLIDINYFKEINDTYGHLTGDKVLEKTAAWIKSIFGDDRCYRYGGDEFLIFSAEGHLYTKDTFTFSVPEIPDNEILLSIGHAAGDPKDYKELSKLISEADGALYEVKKLTHSPEYGGHGERKL